MLTGFEALGAASAVLQVISFAGSIVPLCYNIYDGKPTQETELEEYAKRLIETAGRVQARSQVWPKITPDEKSLAETAQKCVDAANDLKVETDYVTKLCQKGKLPKAIHAAFRSSRHRSKIERLKKVLQQCRQIMETELLFKVCNKSDAIQIQQTSRFQSLDSDIQNLVSRISQGYSKVEDLVKAEHHTTRDIVRGEGRTTREQVTNHVTSEVQALTISTISDKQRERLLASLKAPEMNQRYNKIMDHDDATFERIFLAYEGLVSEECYQSDSSDESLPEIDETWNCFTSWLQADDSRIFWVRGKPGSGKSTLMKFLIESHQTKQLLELWNPGSSIISHFFWKIGSPFQNTIQGLLCGLLHQILSHDNDKLVQVLSHFNAVSSKDYPHDWSDRELQEVLLFILRLQTHSTCIFIDGLDEVSNKDGYLKLLNVVEELNLSNNVKVCVSSRPETQLVNRLTEATSLRLEDLTRPDMTAYVRKELLEYLENGQLSISMDAELTEMLLGKAEGVFLWLSLAMKSVTTGIQNNDINEILIQRLSELPGELEGLYTDMWTRLNGNNSVYRQTATRYFRHVIARRTTLSTVKNPDLDVNFFDGPTLAEIAIAESPTVNEDVRIRAKDLTLEELKRLCLTTVDDIQKRCAGLLQLPTNQPLSGLPPGYEEDEVDFAYIMREPDFIHRTAHDFLVETEAGQRILNYNDDSSLSIDTDVRIFKSMADLMVTFYKLYHVRFISWSINSICARLFRKGYSKTLVLRMLETISDLHSQGILALYWDYDARSPSHHFISDLAYDPPLLDNFIEPLLQQADSHSAATDILRDITDLWLNETDPAVSMPSTKFVHKMLELGADPHIPGLPHLIVKPFNSHTTSFGSFLLASFRTYYLLVRDEADCSAIACKMSSTGVYECWRIKNQQPFEDLIDLVFHPVDFQEQDLNQFIVIAGSSGNAEKVEVEAELDALTQEVPNFFRLTDLGIYPKIIDF
ncbi:hypothetical protein FSARC_3522 [Fusarium sarcochroum]|uniref:NACHT domain-containing protein n=1 Tax=Fusarium sarcochroum TaxID=1208366 RepID=A0A8H4U499_9HYPO|nr:hypothetical protein FSARC_3522 [Fusarium sarcochroum]